MKQPALVGLILLVGSLTYGCGKDSPVAPTPPQPAYVAGGWTGTLGSSNFTAQAVSFLLVQAGTTVTGTWSIASGVTTGTITGTINTSSFAGTFTTDAPSDKGVRCTGTASVGGPAGAGTFVWTSPGFSGNCNNMPTNLTFRMQRQ